MSRHLPRPLIAALAIAASALMGAAWLPSNARSATTASFGPNPVTFTEIAVGSGGTIFASDCGNARIYRIRRQAITVFAGAGDGGFTNGYSGDGGPASEAHFGCPTGLLVDADGSVLVADHLNDVIRRIDSRGIVTTIVGSGPHFTWSKGPWVPGLKGAGDGGPALSAWLDAPWDIVRGPDGSLFIADRDHDAVRRVRPDGTITTIAGTGQRGFGGDGGPAVDARLDRSLDVAFSGDSTFIADENNARIRRVARDGTITTFAGTGRLGCDATGKAATDAPIQNPNAIAFLGDGSLLVTSEECHQVRRIGTDGTVHAFLGTGVDGCAGFDGPAASAVLDTPGSVRVGGDGIAYVADSGCRVILSVDLNARVRVVADGSSLN